MLQVCYVVVTAGWDRHAQMAWVSAQSVRIQQPDARIVIVAECTSNDAEHMLRERLGRVADALILVTSTVPDPVGKSRYHKMALSDYITGDVLYLDSDTLAVAPLADVLKTSADVAAVCDCNNEPADGRFPPELEEPFLEFGWTYPLPYYLNAGVIFFRGNAATSAFCAEWRRRFQASTARRHVWDQATFNSALFASGINHAVLPHRFNTMIVKRNYRPRHGAIWHFFGSPQEQQGTLMEYLMGHLSRTGTFDRVAYERAVRQGHPWGPDPAPWQLHHSGNHARAALAKIQQTVRRNWQRLSHLAPHQ